MAEELLVVLNRKDPTCGLGFSLLGTPPGLPPIIYEIVENSPAAESGKVNMSPDSFTPLLEPEC
jgi:PH/SEC7 domain-containing protein